MKGVEKVTPDQLSGMLTQLGLSAVFLFMLYKLWQRHMFMTDTIIAILREQLKAEREEKTGVKADAGD